MEGLGRPKRAPGLNRMFHYGGQLLSFFSSDQCAAARPLVGDQAIHATSVKGIDPFAQGPIGDQQRLTRSRLMPTISIWMAVQRSAVSLEPTGQPL